MSPLRGAFTDQYSTASTRNTGRRTSSHGGSGSTVSTSATDAVISMRPPLGAFTDAPSPAKRPAAESGAPAWGAPGGAPARPAAARQPWARQLAVRQPAVRAA